LRSKALDIRLIRDSGPSLRRKKSILGPRGFGAIAECMIF
jgi:hypothetical protein